MKRIIIKTIIKKPNEMKIILKSVFAVLFIAIMSVFTACVSNWHYEGIGDSYVVDCGLCNKDKELEGTLHIEVQGTGGAIFIERIHPASTFNISNTMSISIVFDNGESFVYHDIRSLDRVVSDEQYFEFKKSKLRQIILGEKELTSIADELEFLEIWKGGKMFISDKKGFFQVMIEDPDVGLRFKNAMDNNKSFTLSCPELGIKWKSNKKGIFKICSCKF